MTEWRELGGFLTRRLAMIALILLLGPLAAAAEPDPRLKENPILGRIASVNPAEAKSLLDAIDELLQRPARPPLRGSPDPEPEADEKGLLTENPLLEQTYHRDARAALELLKRIKAAANGSGGPK